MNLHYLHICQSVGQHPHAYLSLMAGGVAGCVLHCASVCALCLSGGATVGASFTKLSRFATQHFLPALINFGAIFLLSYAGDLV